MGKQLRKADGYFEDGRYKAAARGYELALERRPDEARAIVGAARAWALAGESDRALERAEQARDQQLDGAEEAMARALIDLGRGAEAVDLVDTSTEESALLLSEARLAAGDAAGAVDALRDAGEGPDVLVLRAWATWRRDGDAACGDALAMVRDAAAVAYEDPAINWDVAGLRLVCGDEEGATDAARQARIFYLDGPDPLHEAGGHRRDGGDLEGAARLLTRAVALYPDEGIITRDLGVVWLEAKEPALAVTMLQRALPLAPYHQDLAAPAEIVGSGSYDKAAVQAMAGELWASLSVALSGTGDAGNATAARERALLLDDDASATDWAELATAWSKLGGHDQATRAAKKALQLDSADAAVWLTAADVRAHAGDPSDALGYARRAWEIDPGAPAIAVRLAEASLAVGDPHEARRVLETALRRLSGQPHALAGQLQALLQQADRAAGN